jgi:glycosyltransferase involved in cell wall biosynthesis
VSGRGQSPASVPSGRPLHVVVLGSYLRFPHGMAATNRVRLLARAMVEAGVRVRVLSLQAGERPPHVENTQVSGVHQGIAFEYACGTTVRHSSFVVRRLIEARGWTAGALRLARLRRRGQLDAVCLWFTSQRLQPRRLAYLALLRALRVPVVIELNERPWSLRDDGSEAERRRSPLAGVAGVVAISDLLAGWARGEAERLRRRLAVLEVPIVVDVNEQTPGAYPSAAPPLVVFAGAPQYDETIRFIFTAMRRVWQDVPECRLVVSGANPADPAARWLADEARKAAGEARLEIAGYLSRPDLLALYGRASALLVPLFDDVRSEARFPTKIGEYLAAARPVVTSAVGEIPRFFTDGVDAAVCPPGDALAFGERIAGLLRDPDAAAAMGAAGRELAERRFDYALYGAQLRDGFAAVAAGGSSG